MPRKYEPTHEVEYERWGGGEYHHARMRESRNGEWVPLKVFEDEMKRLSCQIKRLKQQLKGEFDD